MGTFQCCSRSAPHHYRRHLSLTESRFQNVPVASFIASILSSKDNPSLVTNALQFVELLLIKSPNDFKQALRKEGVLHEVITISKTELKSKVKPAPKASEDAGEGSGEPPPAPAEPQPKKFSSHVPSDPQDQYVLRCRVIKVKHLAGAADVGGDAVFDELKSYIDALSSPKANEEEQRQTLKEIANLFSSPHTSVSSFELLKSGLVDGLLAFATELDRESELLGFPPLYKKFY